MKKQLLIILTFFSVQQISGQQTYCDFEGTKVITFGFHNGVIDSAFANPAPNLVNSSSTCAKYIRDTALYDNIKIYPDTLLTDITTYAVNTPLAQKITMKLYSTAIAGTLVQLQLGLKSDDTYPSGIHSEYTTTTTAQNAWQDVTFDYFQSPLGSLVLPTQIDKVVLLFHPNSSARDTMYFDSLVGPELVNYHVGVKVNTSSSAKLYQNSPNPAKGNTNIRFNLNTAGSVSIKIYDLLGNTIISLPDQKMKEGFHSIPFTTENIPDGIYFCSLEKDGILQSIKMAISK